MKKFIAKVKHLNVIGENGLQKCYGGYLDISFINNTKVDKGLFMNNVRDTTFDNGLSLSVLNKNKAFKGVYSTLERIESGESPTLMYELNQGGSLMCESIKPTGNTDEYEITLIQDYHGVGNGQQTLSTAWYFKEKNKKEIKNNTLIFFKFLESYGKEKSQEICIANNTNVKINNLDLISNSWNDISNALNNMGIYLKHKANKSKVITNNSQRVIDLTDDNFYNIMNAYHKLQPWKSGQEIIDESLLEGITANILIEIDDLRIEFNKWYLDNLQRFKGIRKENEKKFSVLRERGISRSFFFACYKLHYDPILTIEKFFDICLESFEATIGNDEKGITNLKYFKTLEYVVKLNIKNEILITRQNVTGLLNKSLVKAIDELV